LTRPPSMCQAGGGGAAEASTPATAASALMTAVQRAEKASSRATRGWMRARGPRPPTAAPVGVADPGAGGSRRVPHVCGVGRVLPGGVAEASGGPGGMGALWARASRRCTASSSEDGAAPSPSPPLPSYCADGLPASLSAPHRHAPGGRGGSTARGARGLGPQGNRRRGTDEGGRHFRTTQ